jgi:hypothetical protein
MTLLEEIRRSSRFLVRRGEENGGGAEGPVVAVVAEIGEGEGGDVDAPEGLGWGVEGVEDGSADYGGVGDGDGVGVRVGDEFGEPVFDAGDESDDGFAVVRRGGWVGEPLGDGRGVFGVEVVEGAALPDAVSDVSEFIGWGCGEVQGFGGLLGAEFGSSEDLVGAGWLPVDCGEFGEGGFFEGLICGESGEALGGGWGVADQGETSWHGCEFSESRRSLLNKTLTVILVVRLTRAQAIRSVVG